MLQEERFNLILQELAQNGAVKNINLAQTLNVSESTVRRDINELGEMGKLKKVFGGAVRLENPIDAAQDSAPVNPADSVKPAGLSELSEPAGSEVPERGFGSGDIAARAALHAEEKSVIAKYAAGFICDDDSVFIDAGTTTAHMIDYIDNRKAAYMTNGIIHAQRLARRGFNVNMVSGSVKGTTLSVIGVNAVKSLYNLNFTKCFMGASGIDIERGFTTSDMDEAMIKEEVVSRSGSVYILADSSKFGRVSSVTFARLKETCIITDKLENDIYRKYAVIHEAAAK